MRQFHATIRGRVQGVCFRAETREVARGLGLAGFVRNTPAGEVEVVARGEEGALESLLAFLHRGPALARVTRVEVTWDTNHEADDPFAIRY